MSSNVREKLNSFVGGLENMAQTNPEHIEAFMEIGRASCRERV